MLALEAGRVVSADRLIGQLWAGEAPPSASGTIQAYVSKLRRVLEPDRPARAPATVLVTRSRGYLLAVRPDQVDAHRFEAGLEEGRRLIELGRPLEAEQLLEATLKEWRGDPLPEFADAPFAVAAAVRLREVRAMVAEELAVARLAAGRHARATEALTALVEEFPFRERLWQQLILGLYRAGRQADALDAYRRAQSVLRHELGLAPTRELQVLEERILRQDPALDLTPAVAPATTASVGNADVPPSRQPDRVMVGRKSELDLVASRIAGLRSGLAGVTVVVGEAGVGKTMLARAVADGGAAAGFRVAWGRAVEGGSTPAFWPWIQVVRTLDAAGFAVDELLSVFTGESAATSDDKDPDTARYQLYERAVEVLRTATARTPLVVVIDDLHDADPASVQLLAYVGAHQNPPPVHIVATMRPSERAANPVLVDALAHLVKEPTFRRVDLPVFTVRQVGEYLELGHLQVRPDVVHALHERTGGNPFYIKELLTLIRSEQPTALEIPPAVSDFAVPDSLRDVIGRRVARLPEETRSILEVAAVIGREFDAAVLESAADIDGETLLERIEPALLEGLVSVGASEWELRFTHALVQETVYGNISRVSRARTHLRVGYALRDVGDPTESGRFGRMAHHFAKAARVGGGELAVRYASAAAEQATSALAFDDAVTFLELALSILRGSSEEVLRQRYSTLLALGKAKRAIGDVVGAHSDLDRAVTLAAQLGDDLAVIDAATVFGVVTLWNWRYYGVVDHAMVRILEGGLATVGDTDPVRKASLLGTLGVELYYGDRRGEGRQFAAEAVDLARRFGDRELLVRTLNNRVIASWDPEHLDEHREAIDEILSLGALPRSVEITARMHRVMARLNVGDVAGSDADLARCRALVDEARLPELLVQITCAEAGQALRRGQWERAEELIGVGYELHSRTSMWGADWVRLVLQYTSARFRGRGAELVDELVRATDLPNYELLQPTAVLAAYEAGDEPLARALLDRSTTDVRPSWVSEWLLFQWGLVAAALGAPDPQLIYDQLAPSASHLVVPGTPLATWGSCHYALAALAHRLGRPETALAHAEAALATHLGLGIDHLVDASRTQIGILRASEVRT
ncbi:BTAD domain-containing putative transcriptional regulator [Prescottella agglutinans]|uniref:BTAD domain-containing putative transcriptional regulator n=1 Tax=Prescottella agglutinans TaxID=1644129 RepID=UPI003D96F204